MRRKKDAGDFIKNLPIYIMECSGYKDSMGLLGYRNLLPRGDIEKFDKYFNECFINYIIRESEMDQINFTLKKKLTEVELDNKKLKATANKFMLCYEKEQENFGRANQLCDEMDKKISKLNHQIQVLTKSNKEIQKYHDGVCSDLLAENDELTILNQNLHTEYKNLEFLKDNLYKENDSLALKLKECDNSNIKLVRRNEELQKKNNSLEARIATHSVAPSFDKLEAKTVTHSVAPSFDKLDKLESKLKDVQNAYQNLFQEYAELQLAKNITIQKERDFNLKIEALQIENEELRKSHGSMCIENVQLREKVENGQDKYDECDCLYKLNLELTDEANDLRRECIALEEEVDKLSEDNFKLIDKADYLICVKNENAILNETIGELEYKIGALERINDEMTNTDYPNKKYIGAMAELEDENKSLMEKNISLRDQLDKLRSDCIGVWTDIKNNI